MLGRVRALEAGHVLGHHADHRALLRVGRELDAAPLGKAIITRQPDEIFDRGGGRAAKKKVARKAKKGKKKKKGVEEEIEDKMTLKKMIAHVKNAYTDALELEEPDLVEENVHDLLEAPMSQDAAIRLL